jgi:hypothetical protein
MGKASELLLGTKRGDTDEVNIQWDLHVANVKLKVAELRYGQHSR